MEAICEMYIKNIASVVTQRTALLRGAATQAPSSTRMHRYYLKKLKEKNEAQFDPKKIAVVRNGYEATRLFYHLVPNNFLDGTRRSPEQSS